MPEIEEEEEERLADAAPKQPNEALQPALEQKQDGSMPSAAQPEVLGGPSAEKAAVSETAAASAAAVEEAAAEPPVILKLVRQTTILLHLSTVNAVIAVPSSGSPGVPYLDQRYYSYEERVCVSMLHLCTLVCPLDELLMSTDRMCFHRWCRTIHTG